MKYLLLLAIRLYRAAIPAHKRRKCIFRTSCSAQVYQATLQDGCITGLKALKYRFINCRSDFFIFENPVSGRKSMLLPNGELLPEEQIAERFIRPEQTLSHSNL